MSHRNLTFSKIKQALMQNPASPVVPWQTWSPDPLDGDPRRPARNFQDPRQLPGMEQMTAQDGLTVMMPAVRPVPAVDSTPTRVLPPIQAAQSVENLTATQILPPAPVCAPPSARHVDPAKRTTTFVEDNDLEPETPGRHALNELMAAPDDIRELANLPQRVIADFGGPDTVAKDPARRASVRAFRHARDMQRAREARAAAVISSADETLKRIHGTWNAWDKLLRDLVAGVYGQEAVTAQDQLTAAYEDGGTSAALYTTQQLAQEIARRALAGAGVAA